MFRNHMILICCILTTQSLVSKMIYPNLWFYAIPYVKTFAQNTIIGALTGVSDIITARHSIILKFEQLPEKKYHFMEVQAPTQPAWSPQPSHKIYSRHF